MKKITVKQKTLSLQRSTVASFTQHAATQKAQDTIWTKAHDTIWTKAQDTSWIRL